MATTYHFEDERLKPAVAAYLNSGCNFNEVSSHLKKQMRLFMQESIPQIWLSDGKHYILSHFTKDAINDFRKNYSNIKFSNLREKILVVTKWKLVTRYEDSRTSYCSYQNISIHLVIENFRPLMYEKVAPKNLNSPCIFRDAEIQCLLRNKRHEITQQQIVHKHLFMHSTDFQMPTARDLFESDSSNKFKKLPHDDLNGQLGMMMTDQTEEEEQKQKDMLEKKEFERSLIIDYNKQLLQKISDSLAKSEVIRCEGKEKLSKQAIANDCEDFKEMKEIIMGNNPAEEIAKEAQYYDVKRLLIQERGEDEYYFLYERKHKQLQDKLDDEITRKDLNDNLGHFYNPKDKSRLEFQRQMQIKAMQNAEMKKHKRTKKVIRYRLGYQASEIKDKILRFMTTFNPSTQPNNDETYLEEKNDYTMENPGIAYSQMDHNEQSELIDRKVGGMALSQYYQGPQSNFNGDLGDDTESEPDEDPITFKQKQKLRSLVAQVKPTFSLFKRYYEWFNQHEVTTQSKYEELQENMRRAAAEAAAREAELQKERERKEQLAREREAQLLEAQRLREEQAELERQRKLERKALKLKQQQEAEEQRQRDFQLESERQRLAEEAALLELQQERQRRERELAEQRRIQQELAQAEQERERQAQLEIVAAAEQLRKIQIEEERRRLQEEEARVKHEEALRQQQKALEQREQERLLAEVKARAELEEAEREQRRVREAKAAEEARQQEIQAAEKRRQEEMAAKERERQKQIAAQEALKKEQERQERRRIQLEQEALARLEEERRVLKMRQEEEQRRAKQEAEIERRRYEEQLRIENEIRLKREMEQLAIEALQSKSSKSNSLSQKASQNEEDGRLNIPEQTSSNSDEDCEDGDQQTAAFVVHSQDEEFSPEQIEVQQAPEIVEVIEEEKDQSPQLTPNKALEMVYPQPSPGSFVDQNPVPQPYDESMTLADLVGQHQNGSQQLKPSQEKESSHRHQSKRHKRSQSSHSKSKKHLKKRKNRSSSSESSSSNESDNDSRSLSSVSREASDVDSSEQRSSRNSSSSENSSASERSSSSSDSSSSEEQRKKAELLLAFLNPKKSSKSKKDKKHKNKGNHLDGILTQLLQVAAQKMSKHKKDKSSKKYHKSSSSKNHQNHHSSSRVKDEKPQSVQKIPQPFSLDHQLNASPNLEIKQSPSPSKPGVNYSYKHLDSTQGSTEVQAQKQLSPVEIVRPTVRANAMPTSFDSWKQQNENQNGQNFRNSSPQLSQSKVIPPWNQTRDEEEDNSEQLALLLAQDKTLQKRRRHE